MFENSVSPDLLETLKKIGDSKLPGLYLAGGTALALWLGHRESIDLDFFSQPGLDTEKITNLVVSLQGEIRSIESDTVHAFIGNSKSSFFHYDYPMLEPVTNFYGAKIAGVKDIAAMKVVAISQRGTKKDFYDLYELLKTHPATQVKEWFLAKYGEKRINCYHILRSLFFFDNAELEPDPISLNGTNWATVKSYFIENEQTLFSQLLD